MSVRHWPWPISSAAARRAPTAMCGSPSLPTPGRRWPRAVRRAMHDLGALWADGGRMRLALSDPSRGLRAIVSLETDAGPLSLGRRPSPAGASAGARDARSLRRAAGRPARSAAVARSRPLAWPAERGALRIPAGRGRGAAPDPRRAGPCRHHRAGPFPLHRQRRDGGAARGAVGLRAQGRRGPDGGRRGRARRSASSGASRATARWPMPGPSPAPSRPRWHGRRRRAPCCCAASWPSWSGWRTTSTMSARSATTPACSRSTPAAPCSARTCWPWPTPASAIA